MTHAKLVAVTCVALCVSFTTAEERHSFSDAKHWASLWEGPERDAWQLPFDVLRLIGVSEGETVADIGAGTGYFTRPLSFSVGPHGRVYAIDVEPAMLEYIRARDDVQQDRVETVLARPNDPGLPDGAVDLILVVNTWHHVKKRPAYLAKLDRALKPDGRLVLIDFRKEGSPVGPPPGQKLAREQVVEEFEKAGWRLAAESIALPYQYCLTFYPSRDREAMKILPDPLDPY